MLDNTARQLQDPMPAAPQSAPELQKKPQAPAKPAVNPKAFSPFERVLSAVCGIAAVGVCLLYLSGQTQLANTNRTYQDVQAQIATQNQSVTDLKQTIGELSNSNRLSNYAKAHGLTVIEGNIKRVTK
ncbi:cell division protein FtsL [Lacticaseibacillus baoqingensis]|uniref:Cell division protein FtsL n=1 Tax=Lacticaseibacillus baoqingensis TaxID=2486013 RepID=A0ABW4E3M2_9LACO|nr:cell division protein FtsL [Lacticaseibacillus baoqingensis]